MSNIQQIDSKNEFLSQHIIQDPLYHQKKMINADEAANYIGISKSTLYKHTSKGLIPHYKPNGKLLCFKIDDLDAWLHAKRIPSMDEVKFKNSLNTLRNGNI